MSFSENIKFTQVLVSYFHFVPYVSDIYTHTLVNLYKALLTERWAR